MKIPINVTAKAFNVRVLSKGEITVGIEGIIDTLNGHDGMLRIADGPGNIIVESALPTAIRFTGIQCSTAHITHADNTLLFQASHQREEYGNAEWIHLTGTGYLLRLSAWEYPALHLKRLGLSKACRRLIITLMQLHGIDMLHLDAAGDVLPTFATFDW
ncbi:DUF5983 family protein [Rahnella aceris]